MTPGQEQEARAAFEEDAVNRGFALDPHNGEYKQPLFAMWRSYLAATERMQARVDQLRAAVDELVACEDLKEQFERGAHKNPDSNQCIDCIAYEAYYRRKPLAWAAARALTSKEKA